MHKIFLLLGSNIGKRCDNLKQACQNITLQIGKISKKSSIYQTTPWGNENQPDFLNQALEVETNLNPFEILKVIHLIEKQMGRKKTVKWGERNIDIDILYYENQHIKKPQLEIPHPEIINRKFTLIPMVELAPEFIHPLFDCNQTKLLEMCVDDANVQMFDC